MRILPAAIPSPETAVWWLGPVPLRAYALCILLGIIVAIVMTRHRLLARAGTGEEIYDVALWAIVFGIIGGRIYHVISSPWPYFGENGDFMMAFRIWDGGLGIWGAIALGALGAYISCRRYGHSFLDLADSVAPALLVAQAIGRWGNWFNNELYGGASTSPWAVTIHQWDQSAGEAVRDAAGNAIVKGTFEPTFLYESLWCLGAALALMLLDRRFRFHRGQVLALYVVLYTLGRFFFELMRTDPAQIVLGQRINVWVSLVVLLIGVGIFVVQRRQDLRPIPGEDVALVAERSANATG